MTSCMRIATPAFSWRRLRVSPGVQRRRLLGRRREELSALRKLRQPRPVRVQLLQHPRSLRRRLPQLRQVPPRVWALWRSGKSAADVINVSLAYSLFSKLVIVKQLKPVVYFLFCLFYFCLCGMLPSHYIFRLCILVHVEDTYVHKQLCTSAKCLTKRRVESSFIFCKLFLITTLRALVPDRAPASAHRVVTTASVSRASTGAPTTTPLRNVTSTRSVTAPASTVTNSVTAAATDG